MFGDVVHGSMLFIVGLMLVIFNNHIKSGVLKGALPYRYALTLFGFFAMFMGIIYNDAMSIPFNQRKSCWDIETAIKTQNRELELNRVTPSCVPPIGIDSVWLVSHND